MFPVATALGLSLGCPSAEQTAELAPPGPTPARETAPHPPTTVTRALDRDDVEPWLDGYLPYALQRGDIAGAVVVVVKDGKVLLQTGYGHADVEARKPVDPQVTLFRPGSVSKLFTWTAVMQLVEQGKLELDRDVNRYLDFTIPHAFGAPVTLRHLMTHTAGFEEVNKNVITTDSSGAMPLGAFVKEWVPVRIFPPGRIPAYSNYAAALAGYIVQRASGQPFEDYIERHIFAPLGMEHSTFRQPLTAPLEATMAKGYEVASGEPTPFETVIPGPAGSLSATGEDIGRFMIAHLQRGRYGARQILQPETARTMHTSALTILPAVNRMVLGFYETNRNGRRVIAHAGDTYAFHSDLHLFIDDGVGIYISMNSAGSEEASGAIRSALFEQFADRYLPGPAATGRVDPETAMAHAELIAGIYDNSRRSVSNFFSVLSLLGPAVVTVNEDTTISLGLLTGLGGEPKRWRESAPFVWREVDGKGVLAARVESGKVMMLSGDEVSPFMMFLPTPWWRSPGWLAPLFSLAVAPLLLPLVLWPVAALVRRRYGVPFPLAGRDALAHRVMRLAAVGSLIVLAAWSATFMSMLSDPSMLTSESDPWLLLLQLLSLVVLTGATAAALWHAWVVWSGKRRWQARLWSVLLALASATVLYVALAFKLIAFDVNY
ncbi:MAG: beta-lactamase family protein [Gemmatimonadales bacterium]|nr:beta-lactamase family protein [Gemmatimonadales bacterium]